MKDKNEKSNDVSSGRWDGSSVVSLFLLFALASIMGLSGFVVATTLFIVIGQAIISFPKWCTRNTTAEPTFHQTNSSCFQRIPLWSMGLMVMSVLAVAGFVYSSNIDYPKPPMSCPQLKKVVGRIQFDPHRIQETHPGGSLDCRFCAALVHDTNPDLTEWKEFGNMCGDYHIVTAKFYKPQRHHIR